MDSIHYAYSIQLTYSIYIAYQCLHIVIVLYFTGEFQKAEKICLAYTQRSDVERYREKQEEEANGSNQIQVLLSA